MNSNDAKTRYNRVILKVDIFSKSSKKQPFSNLFQLIWNLSIDKKVVLMAVIMERMSMTTSPPGVAQEGGGGGYHCSSAAGYPKLACTLEIPALEQVGPFCCFLLPVLAHSGQSARCPVLGIQRHQGRDSHFCLVLGLPYTITINIPCYYRV